MLKLISLQYFIAIARCGSFTKAADQLFISQPTLSRAISELEKELEVPLFVREYRSLQLTEEGRILLKEATEIVDRSERLTELFHNNSGVRKGKKIILKIGYQKYFDIQRIYPILKAFRKEHTNYEILLEQVEVQELRRGIDDGSFDLVFGLYPYFQRISGLTVVPVQKNCLKLIVSEKHPLAEQDTVSIADLEEEEFVLLNRKYSPAVVDYVISQCVENGYSPNVSHYVDNIHEAIELVGMNKGISFMHSGMDLAEHMSQNSVVAIDISYNDINMDLMAAYRKGHKNAATLELFEKLKFLGE